MVESYRAASTPKKTCQSHKEINKHGTSFSLLKNFNQIKLLVSKILVIGGGPAGLRAAEVASATGAEVILCDQKRSVGRKFLVAGKGGLNLTHSEQIDSFQTRYQGPDQPQNLWPKLLRRFDNDALRTWAAQLEVDTFVQRSGRVYPTALKAAPLLRRWLARLRTQGVSLRMQHRMKALRVGSVDFETPNGSVTIHADAIILALGGGSWPATGSDGAWVQTLQAAQVDITSLHPANCGWEVNWPEELRTFVDGKPLKNISASVGPQKVSGEIMLTQYGMEGGPIYQLGPALRTSTQPIVSLDLKPTFTVEQLVNKMGSVKKNFLRESKYRWKLCGSMQALLAAYHGPFDSAQSLAQATKSCAIPFTKPRPLEEAISSAGGIAWPELDEDLMLPKLPGVFAAGEMIDWEAPTGGYLLQGCFASGTFAAEAALAYCASHQTTHLLDQKPE